MTVMTQPGPFTSSTLPNGRIAYWKLDEASGVALDSGPNALHLTDNNTVGAAAGQINGSRLFAAASIESLSIANNAFQANQSFTLSYWANLTTLAGTVVSRFNQSGPSQTEYLLFISSSKFAFNIYATGASASNSVTSAITLSTGAWFHVAAWLDLTNTQIGISVNNETPVLTTKTVTITVATAPFVLGGRFNGSAGQATNGLLDNVQFWNRLLTPAERAEVYANGLAGRES